MADGRPGIPRANGWTHCPHIGCGWNYVGDLAKAAPCLGAHIRLMHAGKHIVEPEVR